MKTREFRYTVFGMGLQAMICSGLSFFGVIDLNAGQQLIAALLFFTLLAALAIFRKQDDGITAGFDSEFVDVDEAIEMLKIDQSNLTQLVADGKLEAHTSLSGIRFHKAAVISLKEEL